MDIWTTVVFGMFAVTLIAHMLAALISIGSFSFYAAAFFYPEVSRSRDVVWSALGFLYAAVLWFCAAQMTAAILMGQLIATVLLGVLGWQTLSIRREKTPVYQQTPVVITPEVAGNWAKNTLNQLRIAPAEPVPLKLEKRSLSEFSEERLGVPLDPRRRPAYEYEFVEDGLWQDELWSDSGDEDAEQRSLSLLEESPLLVDVTPPSAIADVISVEAPDSKEADSKEADSLDSETLETTAKEHIEGIKTSVTVPLSTEPAAAELAEPEVPDTESIEPDSQATVELSVELNAAPTETARSGESSSESIRVLEPHSAAAEAAADRDVWDDSDWGEDELIAMEPAEVIAKKTSEPSSMSASSNQKPALSAIPIILAGWIKDVAISFAKPKPSKPVIDIPRRDPSIPRPSDTSSFISSLSNNSEPNDSVPNHSKENHSFVSRSPISQTVAAESNWDEDSSAQGDSSVQEAVQEDFSAQEESNWDD